ncbi:MAG: metallophosphoesterase [Patescibacteria group bacterium]
MSHSSNYWLLAIFLVVAISVVFGSHFFVYYSVVNFFKIVSYKSKLILALILTLLPMFFFAASIVAHLRETLFTRIFYFSASLWFGILTELVVGFALGWLIIGVTRFAGYSANTKILGLSVIALVLIYVSYGIFSVFNPQVKYIDVKIKNLPDAWEGKTAVQISDVHLGHILTADFLHGIVGRINELNPEIVFITGDLFDGMDGDLTGVAKPLENIKAPWGMFYVTGNHETYLGVEKAFAAIKDTGIKILNDEEAGVEGMQIVGVSYPERGASKNIGEAIKAINGYNPDLPSILLYHSPVQIEQIKEAGIDFELSGHTHKGQIFPLRFVTWLIYKGYDYGLHTEGDFSIYTSSGVGVWGPTMRTAATPEIVVIKFE